MERFYLKHLLMILFLASTSINYLNAQVTDTIRVHTGWNMISLPLKVLDSYYLTLFPSAKSLPYDYEEYYPGLDTLLKIGKGYWIKFDSAETFFITGEPIHSFERWLSAGWQMIGSISYPVLIRNIQYDTSITVHSDYFRFNPASGYEKSDTINPGTGYWVRVDRPCKLILISMGYPCPGIPTVEYEGKTYNIVQIGNQCWLKENLDVGMMILMIIESDTTHNDGIIEKYCWSNDTTCCTKFGGLYTWNEAMQYTTTLGAQGICPHGWHIPTYTEFEYLSQAVGRDGNALKAIGWGTGDGVGTNTSGFSAFLAGLLNNDCHMLECFNNLGYSTYFWSSSESNSDFPYCFILTDDTGKIDLLSGCIKENGHSVRCIKD